MTLSNSLQKYLSSSNFKYLNINVLVFAILWHWNTPKQHIFFHISIWSYQRSCSKQFHILILTLIGPCIIDLLDLFNRAHIQMWICESIHPHISWRREWQPTLVFLPESPMNRGAWQAPVHEGAKSWTWLRNWVCIHIHKYVHRSLKKEVFHI